MPMICHPATACSTVVDNQPHSPGTGVGDVLEHVETVYTDLQLQGLVDMPESEGAQRLMQHNKRKTGTLNGYAQKFSLYQAYNIRCAMVEY